MEREAGFQMQLAGRELARGLRNLGLAREPIVAPKAGTEPATSDTVFTLAVNQGAFQHPEAYEISQETVEAPLPRIRLSGATPQAVLYAVFDFLERQGAFFGLDGEVYPLEPAPSLEPAALRAELESATAFWRTGTRALARFPNCITVFNREELRAYLEAMLRMRFNTLGVHVYSGKTSGPSPFSPSIWRRAAIWRTRTPAPPTAGATCRSGLRSYGMGAADFYRRRSLWLRGHHAGARNTWEAQEFAQQLWGEAFRYARNLGIRTGVGFEPYQIPDEIFRATPPRGALRAEGPQDSPARASTPNP